MNRCSMGPPESRGFLGMDWLLEWLSLQEHIWCQGWLRAVWPEAEREKEVGLLELKLLWCQTLKYKGGLKALGFGRTTRTARKV